MAGMNHVGDLFGAVRFPQVVKTVRTYEESGGCSSARLLNREKQEGCPAGKVLLATESVMCTTLGKILFPGSNGCNGYER